MKKTNSGCYVVDHAIEDPDWGIEYAEKFCNGDCDNCHFHYAEVFLTGDTETFKNNVSNQLGKDNELKEDLKMEEKKRTWQKCPLCIEGENWDEQSQESKPCKLCKGEGRIEE